MKILHIIWSAQYGGIERLVIDLSRCQTNNSELEPAIFVASKHKGNFTNQIKKLNIKTHQGMLASGFDCSPVKFHRILNILRQYDILHFHVFNPIVATCAAITNKTIIYTEHGNFGFGRRWSTADSIKDYLKNIFLKKFTNHITYNSNFTKETAEKRYNLAKVPRQVVYNGSVVNTSEPSLQGLDRKTLEATEGKFVVGTTSRFAGFKRIDRLISAFSNFQKNKEVLLLLVGDGALKEAYQKQIEKLQINHKTLFTGFQENVRAYQQKMDICVFPSCGEPFGLVALETLSLGKPTIVFQDGGGLTEIVRGVDPENIVPDVEELARRISSCYQNKCADHSEKEKIRKQYIKRFSIEIMSDTFTNIYKQTEGLTCAE